MLVLASASATILFTVGTNTASDTGTSMEENSRKFQQLNALDTGIHTGGPELWHSWLIFSYAVQAVGFAAASLLLWAEHDVSYRET